MNKKNILGLMFVVSFIFLLSFVRISFMAGSHRMFFSGINLLFPLLGSFLGTAFSGVAVFIFFIFKKITLGGAITLGLPTFVATIAFSIMTKDRKNLKLNIYNFLLRVVVPFLSIVLFVVHPAGRDAFLYSFYWLIPVGLYFFEILKNNNSILLKSLTATFLAHAVGSLIWLYMIPTTSVYWLSLIPVVFVERLVFASGLSLTYLIIKKINFVVYVKKHISYLKLQK